MTARSIAARSGAIDRTPAAATVRVWDPLVRIFHWSLVTSFAVAWFAEEGEWLHEWAGYIVLGLVGFRILWGFIGPEHARFTSFVPSPAQALAYLRDMVMLRARRHLGHNPAGGAMIVMLLAMLLLTSGSGWLMITDAFWGVEWVEELHETVANLTVVLIFAHVAGVVISSLAHRENLVKAMVTGRKRVAQ